MRGAVGAVFFSWCLSVIGCGNAAVDIQATPHGKRLNLVAVEGSSTNVAPPSLTRSHQPVAVAELVGRIDPKYKIEQLEQWRLSEDGRSYVTRSCDVNLVAADCTEWGPAPQMTDLGVSGVAYIFSDGDTETYAQTVIEQDSVSASQRFCPVTADGVSFDACRAWTSVDRPSVNSLGR